MTVFIFLFFRAVFYRYCLLLPLISFSCILSYTLFTKEVFVNKLCPSEILSKKPFVRLLVRYILPAIAHTTFMLTVFIRSIITYIFLLFIMRLMGKRQLSELQPFEFVITLIVAELACIPMSDTSIQISYGIIPMFTMFILHILITKLASKNHKFNRFLNGVPVVVISPKGIDHRLLDKLDMNVTDLLHALRAAGYFYPSEVAYAIMETNGTLSVLPKSGFAPATPQDLSLSVDESEMPYPIICEGALFSENLLLTGVSEQALESLLERHDLKPADVLLLTTDKMRQVYLQPYVGDAITEEHL